MNSYLTLHDAQADAEQVPLRVWACSTSHVFPLHTLHMSFVITLLWKIAPSRVCCTVFRLISAHTYHLSMILFYFFQESLPVAMGDSFKVMEHLFCDCVNEWHLPSASWRFLRVPHKSALPVHPDDVQALFLLLENRDQRESQSSEADNRSPSLGNPGFTPRNLINLPLLYAHFPLYCNGTASSSSSCSLLSGIHFPSSP